MDKIREEFEKHMKYVDPRIWWVEEMKKYSVRTASEDSRIEESWNNKYYHFEAGYKSHDEEIEKLTEFERIDKIRIEEGLAEIKKLREIIECKNILLVAYRLGTRKGVEKALDRLHVLKDGE